MKVRRTAVVTIVTHMPAYCRCCNAAGEHDVVRSIESEVRVLRCRACQHEGRYAPRDRPWGVFLGLLGLLLVVIPWAVLIALLLRGDSASGTLLGFVVLALIFIFPGVALALHGWRRFLGDASFGANLPQVERFHPLMLELSGIYLALFGVGVFALNLYNGIAQGFEPYAGLATLFAAGMVLIGRQTYLKGKSLETG